MMPNDPNTSNPSGNPLVNTPATPPIIHSTDNTKAIIALVAGILSLVCCGFFSGIPAIFVGRSELKAIDEGRSSESNRALAKIGFILGIIGTILSILGIIAYVLIFVFAIIFGASNTPNTF